VCQASHTMASEEVVLRARSVIAKYRPVFLYASLDLPEFQEIEIVEVNCRLSQAYSRKKASEIGSPKRIVMGEALGLILE